MLENAGFIVDSIGLIYRPTVLPTGMEAWIKLFADPFLRALLPEQQAQVSKLFKSAVGRS